VAPTRRKTAKPAERLPAAAPRAADKSLGEVLRTKSVERILPEVLGRVERGRHTYVREAAANIDAELELLEAERRRLEHEPSIDPARPARLARLLAAVAADRDAQRGVAAEIERAVLHQPGGFTVVGRVLQRSGAPLAKAAVEFVADGDQAVRELGTVAVGGDGSARKAYPAELVAKLSARGIAVGAAVRVGQRVVAVDAVRVRVAADTLYSFDLRADIA
jgi:hypothetical protein